MHQRNLLPESTIRWPPCEAEACAFRSFDEVHASKTLQKVDGIYSFFAPRPLPSETGLGSRIHGAWFGYPVVQLAHCKPLHRGAPK
ncbi:hypothetical protein D3C76_1218470 [compost metagenome]